MTLTCADKIELLTLADLKAAKRNARTHSKRQIELIAASIRRWGFNTPIIIDDENRIIAGHGRAAAATDLGLSQVPCIRVGDLSEADKRAYALADNAIATKSGWDKETLAIELGELVTLDFDVKLTGFELSEVDQFLSDYQEAQRDAPTREDDPPPPPPPARVVTQLGDVWALGPHRLVCGDAKDANSMRLLMEAEHADMAFTDPPYNIKIEGVVTGRGKARHREFVEASGELTTVEFTDFLQASLGCMASACRDGAILFTCMDWRHIGELFAAGKACDLELKNLCVWTKTNGGQGAFYRSKHELVAVWKHGRAEHTNTFGLGEAGRSRTNVWQYAGVNTFKSDRAEELSRHPTSKPVALVADAIRDVSHRNQIVLDPFGGSGTTLIAAHKTGRRARLIELDPAYCDVIVRRWQTYTGKQSVLEPAHETFEVVENLRQDNGEV